jgi:hypothetical protein
MGHGDADPVVRYEWGQGTAKVLQEWGWNVDFKTYKGLPHSAAPQEINDLERYIKERIPDLFLPKPDCSNLLDLLRSERFGWSFHS